MSPLSGWSSDKCCSISCINPAYLSKWRKGFDRPVVNIISPGLFAPCAKERYYVRYYVKNYLTTFKHCLNIIISAIYSVPCMNESRPSRYFSNMHTAFGWFAQYDMWADLIAAPWVNRIRPTLICWWDDCCRVASSNATCNLAWTSITSSKFPYIWRYSLSDTLKVRNNTLLDL